MDLNRKKQIVIQSAEACSNMIMNIRQLRLSVLDLFTTLADNGADSTRNHEVQQENLLLNRNATNKLYRQQIISNLTTSHQLCTSSLPSYNIQKQQEQQQQADLIQYVNQMISSIASTVRNLDQDLVILMQNYPPGQVTITTGETLSLGMDGSLERHNLYKDLCKSYKTFTKLHDYATTCHALLHQQSLKRVHKRFETTSNIQAGRDPRAESIVATFNPYIYKISLSRTSIINTLETCLKMCEFMKGIYSQPFGVSTGVLQISVNRVLKAILVMRGIVIDAVIVKAHHESFALKATSKPGSSNSLIAGEMSNSDSPFVDTDDDIDLWSQSKYTVFRKLTHHANAAVLHFQYPTYPEIAVRSFLSWFNSYSDLFNATCSRCNSKLRRFMPPICRDFSSGFQPHHDSCK